VVSAWLGANDAPPHVMADFIRYDPTGTFVRALDRITQSASLATSMEPLAPS